MSNAQKGWIVQDSKSKRFFNGNDWGLENKAHRFSSAIVALETVTKMFEVAGGSSVAATDAPYNGIVSVVLLSDIPIDHGSEQVNDG